MKTVRLETVFSSFQKQGCFCGFHRFLYLIPADIFLKQLSTPAQENRSFRRVVFHIFHRSYPLLAVQSSMRLCDLISFYR